MNNEIVTLLNGLNGYMEKIGRPQVSDSRVAKEKAAAKTVQKAKVGPPSCGFVRLRSPFFGGGSEMRNVENGPQNWGPKCRLVSLRITKVFFNGIVSEERGKR